MNLKIIDYFKEEYKARFEEIHLQEIYKWKAFKRGPKKAGKYVRPPFPVSKLKAYRKFNWS